MKYPKTAKIFNLTTSQRPRWCLQMSGFVWPKVRKLQIFSLQWSMTKKSRQTLSFERECWPFCSILLLRKGLKRSIIKIVGNCFSVDQLILSAVLFLLYLHYLVKKKLTKCFPFPAWHPSETLTASLDSTPERTDRNWTEDSWKDATPNGPPQRYTQRANWLEKTERDICPATIITKNQTLSLSAWWQLLMEMLQMRPSNNE